MRILIDDINNGNLSLKASKIKQRNMEDVIEKIGNYNPNSEKYRTQKNKYTFQCKRILKRKKNVSYCI